MWKFSKNINLFENIFQRTGSISKYQHAVGEENFLRYTKHGHMGLAVTSGRFYSRHREQFVAGAPHVVRGESGTGEIYFYERDPGSDTLAMDEARMLSGGGFGAGYGFALATLDANGDGLDDLLVSAPFSGAVFLYLNDDYSLDRDTFIEIRGSEPEDQFGLAVTSLGDVNKDGFDDFAVGAPYEGAGVVYLFLGSVDGVAGPRHGQRWLRAADVASQLIRAEDLVAPGSGLPLPSHFATFGSSLSGGLDLDDNGYPGERSDHNVEPPDGSNDLLINYLGHQQIIDKDNKLPHYNSVTSSTDKILSSCCILML